MCTRCSCRGDLNAAISTSQQLKVARGRIGGDMGPGTGTLNGKSSAFGSQNLPRTRCLAVVAT